MRRIANLIAGKWTAPQDGKYFDDHNPATGEKIAEIPSSTAADIKTAVAGAQTAQPEWGALPVEERAVWLDSIASALEARSDEIAELESRDTGKPVALARAVDAARSALNFRFFAELVRELPDEQYKMKDALNVVVRKPVGVAGLITPWNLPLYLLSWKVAPAILMGNCVVCKPSRLTPLTANLLAEVVTEAGLPPGVVNLVHGSGSKCGQALVEHPAVGAISFTGGTSTGRSVAAGAAPLFKKLSLELGGKNATIVCGDADLEKTIPEAARAAFMNQGQVCLCGSRLLVERSIWDEFVPRFVAYVKAMSIGDPASCDLGALVSQEHRKKVESYVALAQEEGGTVLCGGERPTLEPPFDSGAFLEPAVIEGLAPDSRSATEEIFGPVVTLHPFENDDEALAIANNTEYGLAGSVWTRDLERGRRIAEGIDTGMVWVNCWLHRDLRVPFGGIKNSGVGREGGRYSLEFFSEPTNICLMEA
ncbi:MAG: aldehyde dehydrogenase [Candidatus Thermoplasmatota archaeon]|nr:aldehyde dehydrogenase [Candidatus Thermoplasmatota archaeon]